VTHRELDLAAADADIPELAIVQRRKTPRGAPLHSPRPVAPPDGRGRFARKTQQRPGRGTGTAHDGPQQFGPFHMSAMDSLLDESRTRFAR
jgi:hypothetical protein